MIKVNTDECLQMAFWSMNAGSQGVDADELLQMSRDLAALAEDAVSYWIQHGTAPLLAEVSEDNT
jgi:hypothetical protein